MILTPKEILFLKEHLQIMYVCPMKENNNIESWSESYNSKTS